MRAGGGETGWLDRLRTRFVETAHYPFASGLRIALLVLAGVSLLFMYLDIQYTLAYVGTRVAAIAWIADGARALHERRRRRRK